MKKLAKLAVWSYIDSMTKLDELKKHLRPGQVYRREDLARWSRAVDRHLQQLVKEGTLTKLAGGFMSILSKRLLVKHQPKMPSSSRAF